jgi:hypothetical protein
MHKIVKSIYTVKPTQLEHEGDLEGYSHCSSDSQLLLTEFAALLAIHKSLAKKQYKSAVLDEAKKIAFLIEEDSFARVEALENLAAALAQAGRYDEAKDVLKIVKNSPVVKAKELRELGVALARAGSVYIEEAMNVLCTCEKVTNTIKHKATRVKALEELVFHVINSGGSVSNVCNG